MALSFSDVIEQSANGVGNPIHQIESLCCEIDYLNKRVAKLLLEAAKENKQLRDEFAGKAMQGLLVGSDVYKSSVIATLAYEVADAMLKQREVINGQN